MERIIERLKEEGRKGGHDPSRMEAFLRKMLVEYATVLGFGQEEILAHPVVEEMFMPIDWEGR